MTIMITGGAGFVGLNVAEQLLAAGRHVVSFGLEAPSAAFVDKMAAGPGAIDVELGDVRDRQRLMEAMRRHKVRLLVHAAAITAGAEREARQPDLVAAVNLGGAIEVLEAARQCGVRRVVQLSSGSVFGSSVKQDGSLDEINDVPVPETLYGITKYAAERVAIRYRATGRLDVGVVRVGTCFGRWEHDTGQRDTLSIPFGLMRLAQAGKRAVFRKHLPDDWVYATDVADGIVRILTSPDALPQALYHVSSGRRWSASDWCDRLATVYPEFSYEISDEPSALNIGVAAPTPRPPFSIRRAQADFGYTPRFSPDLAFADYMEWERAS